jgi:sulfate adenylyltransferase subunit 2
MSGGMEHLDELENRSVHIFREAYANFKNLGMLWSIGKDSTVMLWLARKAFFGHVPIPLIHIDTSFKIPEMIEYRDRLALEWNLTMIYGQNRQALEEKKTYPDGALDRIACCKALKTDALKYTLSGEWPRFRLNHAKKAYEVDRNTQPYTGIIVGARADEEGSRSKERYFSPRNAQSHWDVGDQPPEFWNQFKTEFAPGTHLRIHPLLDWTELNIWEYIKRVMAGATVPSAAIPALCRWSPMPATWTRLSRSCGRASLPTSPSARDAHRTRRAAAGSRCSGATGTCKLCPAAGRRVTGPDR